VLAELEPACHDPGSEAANAAGVRAMARHALAGELPPRELAEWALGTYERGLDLVVKLVLLEDLYCNLGTLDGTEEDVDERVMAEVRRITR
jgi:hypothetical protein